MRRLPLHDEHARLGCKMIESDGWVMPLEFSGVFQEYQAHRKASVVWDASNLGSIQVSGAGAYELIQNTFTNDLRRCRVGRSQYSFLLTEADASIVDELMIWWVDSELFILIPSRPREVLGVLLSVWHARSRRPCAVEDIAPSRVLLAVQGPSAESRIAEIVPSAVALAPFRVRTAQIGGTLGIAATTRFARKPGFELHLAPSVGRAVYRSLVANGVAPAGLGMRETHRLEAGIPRYGAELGPGITPLEAGFARAVGFDTDFIGRAALLKKQQRGIDKVLRTIVMTGPQAAQPGAGVFSSDTLVGHVTSSNFSLALHRGIAFAYMRPEVELGSQVTIPAARGDVVGQVAGVPVGPRTTL
jgi:aminomethyltransferase